MGSSLGGAVLQGSDALHSDNPGASPCVAAFRIGGVCVQLEGARHGDVTLVPSLVPFRVENCVPDITIQVQWVAKLSPRRDSGFSIPGRSGGCMKMKQDFSSTSALRSLEHGLIRGW